MAAQSKPEFALLVRRTVVTSIPVDEGGAQLETPIVQELDLCAFHVSQPERDKQYAIRMGDEWPDEPEGEDFGEVVRWQYERYFESARGRVIVYLLSRDANSEGSWDIRSQLSINVLPTKLGEERYQSMFDDLRAVSVGLVFDLLSKSRIGLGLTGLGAISLRPANAELIVLKKLWDSVSFILQQIASQPAMGLSVRSERRLSWGGDQLRPSALRMLAMQGIDPRRRNTPRPFYLQREIVFESTDIPEHRAIVGFLKFLQQRVGDCASRAKQHIVAIQKDRPFRDVDQGDGSNLFRDIDQPRMERLKLAVATAAELNDRVASARSLPYLSGVPADFRVPSSPVFMNVAPYRRLRDEMLKYFGASVAILDEGIEDRTKSTGRMYEQWVFLQVLAAIKAAGLSTAGQDSFVTPLQHRRFTVDFERGTRVMFGCPDGRTLSVRYEPWVHPAPLARSLHDTYYRGRTGENSWSPDILIELLSSPRQEQVAPILEYAIVIDAKYTSEINTRHKDGVRKYNEIRSTFDDRPIVNQVWLAYPKDTGIVPWDEAVEWTSLGPNRPRNEVVNGCLGALPPIRLVGEASDSAPNETIVDFIQGILTYLNVARPAS